jgi:hypothetical protein
MDLMQMNAGPNANVRRIISDSTGLAAAKANGRDRPSSPLLFFEVFSFRL